MSTSIDTVISKPKKKNKKVIEYFTEKNKNIIIHYDELFNNPDLKQYNVFRLAIGKKRAYATMAKLMCDDNNMLLSMDQEVASKVMFAHMNIKKAIDDGMFIHVDSEKDLTKYGTEAKRDFGKYKNFITFLISSLYFPDFVNLVKDYVNSQYVDVDETKSLKYASGSTFNNEQFKLFYTISFLSKFAIPLCTHYIHRNSDKNIKVYDFMYTVFSAIFDVAVIDSKTTDLMRKLYQYVALIVRRTQNSNKYIWDRFPLYNDTEETIVEEIVIKIVTTLVPKFNLEKPIISLIMVVSRDSVGLYKIRAKHPFDCYKVSDNNSTNDEEDKLSESEIWDLYYHNIDESALIFNRFGNNSTIDDIMRRNNIYINDQEVKFYMENYTKHSFTVKVITQCFATYFSGAANVRSVTPEQFVKLVIIMKQKMKVLGINYLPQFLTANRESYSFIRMPSAGILKALKVNPDYNELVENKYKFIQNLFDIKTTTGDDRNPIKDMIIGLIHNDYVYCDFDNKSRNGQKIVIDENLIVNDVLQIYKKLIV